MTADPPSVILATDCGSTTTKAILILREDGHFRLKVRGEAPTTVESPYDDVTVGVLNAVGEVEELSGLRLVADGRIALPRSPDGSGADIFVSTSSAGGGLQMMVAGVVRSMTAESAERAALGAGAIVMDVVAADDGREEHERIERIRRLRPDMVLLSGGTDGGTKTHVVEMAEMLLAADPRPRLGIGYRIPVIYAGNKDARSEVEQIIGDKTALEIVENLRPTLEEERLGEARATVHRLFLEHVMQQAPGYNKLMTWVSAPIMPTPHAVGNMVQTVAQQRGIDVLAVDVGGATTDIFSVFGGVFNRTVSANLGLSYSICNVLKEAGVENISRWLPFEMANAELTNRLRNKMIRPTTIPQTMEDLLLEQAVAREALRLALQHHRSLAVGLKGVRIQRTVGDLLSQEGAETLVDMMSLGLIIGSGGVLSHAPQRSQAALMMIDAFQPEGVTELAVDSIFMMPQLGVLAQVLPEAAMEVFERDCLIFLGTCVAVKGQPRPGRPALRLRIPELGLEKTCLGGQMEVIPLPEGKEVEAEIEPVRPLDVGSGPGRALRTKLRGGVVGLMIDCRGRPLPWPTTRQERIEASKKKHLVFGVGL
jgi:uncharacterized protein (TIGR01319 family)